MPRKRSALLKWTKYIYMSIYIYIWYYISKRRILKIIELGSRIWYIGGWVVIKRDVSTETQWDILVINVSISNSGVVFKLFQEVDWKGNVISRASAESCDNRNQQPNFKAIFLFLLEMLPKYDWQLIRFVYFSDYENLIEGGDSPWQLPTSFYWTVVLNALEILE